MKRGEAVTQADGFVRTGKSAIAAGGEKVTRPSLRIIYRISRDADLRPAGSIGRIQNGDYRVEAVIGAAQKDEEQFFAIQTNGAFGEGPLDDERDVHQGREGRAEADLKGAVQKAASSKNI